jgi:hypothetical protein
VETEPAQPEASCAKCAKKTSDGINAKTCAGTPQYLCIRCYVAWCHTHASCRSCFGLNGTTATWRNKEKKSNAVQLQLEERAKMEARRRWEVNP